MWHHQREIKMSDKKETINLASDADFLATYVHRDKGIYPTNKEAGYVEDEFVELKYSKVEYTDCLDWLDRSYSNYVSHHEGRAPCAFAFRSSALRAAKRNRSKAYSELDLIKVTPKVAETKLALIGERLIMRLPFSDRVVDKVLNLQTKIWFQ